MSTELHIIAGFVNQCVNRSVVQKQQEALTFALVPVELIDAKRAYAILRNVR